MGKKNEARAAVGQPVVERREGKRKHAANIADAVDGRDSSSIQDDTVMEEKEYYVAATRVKDPSTSSQATDVILREKSKNVALTEASVVPKKAKKKEHSACQDNPSNWLPKELNLFILQKSAELLLEIAGVDSKSENTAISHHTPYVVGKEKDPSKNSDIHPDEKLNMAADMRSTSSTRTSGSKKKKIMQRATSVKEDAPNLSAYGYYLSDVVSTNKIEKNNIGESIDTITHPLVCKEDANLTKGVDIGSSDGMKTCISRRDTGVILKVKNSSFSSSQYLQENANRLPSEAAKNHMLLNRATMATDLGSVNKNDSSVLSANGDGLLGTTNVDGGKKRDMSSDICLNSSETASASSKETVRKKKNSAISSDVAVVDISSLSEIVDMKPGKIINRALVGCDPILSTNGDGLLGTSDVDGGKKRDISSDICLNSSETASASSMKTARKKKMNSAVSSDIAAVSSSSLSEIVDMEPGKIINRAPVGCDPILLANGDGLLGTSDVDGGKKRDISSDICLNSSETASASSKKMARKKKNSAVSSDIAVVDSSSLSEIVDMEPGKIINRALVGCDPILLANGGGLLGTTDVDGGKKRDIFSDICLNSSETESASSKKTARKKKKNSAVSSHIAAVDSSSLSEIVDMEPGKIINRAPVGCDPILLANGDGLLGTADVDGGKKRDISSDICLNSSETASASLKKTDRKKKNSAISSDVAAVDGSSLSGCDLVPLVSEETVGLTGVGSDKTDKLLEKSINSEIVIEKRSHTSKKTRRKSKNMIDDCSDSKLEPDPSISSSMNSSLTADFKLAGKINVDSHAVNDEVLNIGTNNSDLAKIAGGSAPNESHSLTELDSDSYQTEEPGSLQTKMAMRKTGKSSNGRTCSPIRGVVVDFASTHVVSKHDNQFDLFKEENVGFSFPVPDKVLLDNSSESHSEKAIQSGVPVGTENVVPANNNDNDLYSIDTCRNSDIFGDPVKKEVAPSSCHIQKFTLSSDLSRREDKELEALLPKRLSISSTRKKLLVLDLNGLLADIIIDTRNDHKAHIKVKGKSVFKRPFCDDFLKFCFDRFKIGIWSSRQRCNVDDVVNYLMGDARHKLLFCWDQSKCTVTDFKTIENAKKPLMLKELKKLWNKEEPDLPWEKGEYSPSNTLLVDDSPYKALCNPPHTAIFPYPYHIGNEKGDTSLGTGGDIRVYLEGLAAADNGQQYVEEHAFGQLAITKTNPSWKFFRQIIVKYHNTSASA